MTLGRSPKPCASRYRCDILPARTNKHRAHIEIIRFSIYHAFLSLCSYLILFFFSVLRPASRSLSPLSLCFFIFYRFVSLSRRYRYSLSAWADAGIKEMKKSRNVDLLSRVQIRTPNIRALRDSPSGFANSRPARTHLVNVTRRRSCTGLSCDICRSVGRTCTRPLYKRSDSVRYAQAPRLHGNMRH